MRKPPTRLKKTIGWLLSAFLLVVYFSPQAQLLRTLPARLSVAVGQQAVLDAPFPLTVEAGEDVSAGASLDETLEEGAGTSTATISFLGLLPLREVEIDISDDLRLYPGGQAVGVALHTQGVLVVGTSDLSGAYSPRASGWGKGGRPDHPGGRQAAGKRRAADGDGGRHGRRTAALDHSAWQQYAGGDAHPTARRPERRLPHRRLGARQHRGCGNPVLLWRAGGGGRYALWARWAMPSPTATPSRCSPVGRGQIMQADVVDVRKGEAGFPGELKGSFLRENRVLGDIFVNNQYGIYGELEEIPEHPLYPDGVPIGRRDAVHTGPATILSTVGTDGNA